MPPARQWSNEPWLYTADPPQRYTGQRDKYLAQGGLVRLEDDVLGFVEGGRNTGDMARFFFFCLMLDQIQKEGIGGNIAELGVYKGDTATLLAGMANRLGKTAYFLDTFEGFSTNDLRGVDAGMAMEFKDTSLQAVRDRIGEDNVKYVQGFFPETADQLPSDGTYCLIHIDCDLYAPMLSALEYFYPRMAPGGYMVLHDYSSLHWGGAERAIDEFFSDKVESVIGLPDGSGSAVVRRAKAAVAPSEGWLAKRRARATSGEWIEGCSAAFSDLVVDGWSGMEAWGTWGIGAAHRLALPMLAGLSDTIVVEVEASAVLIGARTEQVVDIVQDGAVVDSWLFTPANNLGVRKVTLRAPAGASEGPATLAFEFRPRNVATPRALDPNAADDRELGLGLVRLRAYRD